ncbi:MAG: zinc-ribbon domain-containing protein [Clostridiales bacterium]|nr:zinc-ribbon domain-containing protein [Clostridiales bacterium]
MKKISKIFACILILFIMLTGCVAFAENSEADIQYNDKQQTFVVAVTFEKNDFKVSFITPDGRTIDENDGSISLFKGEKVYMYTITNAAEGQWKISYDKGSNEYLGLKTYYPGEPINITKLDVSNITGSSIDVTFTTSCAKETGFDYKIYLGTDVLMNSKVELNSGRANSGEIVTKTISMEKINSYDKYYIAVEVSYKDGSTVCYDMATSKEFKFTNDNTIEPISDYYVENDTKNQTVSVELKDLPYGTKQANIIITEDGKEIYNEMHDSNIGYKAMAGYSDDAKNIKVSVTVKNSDGRVSAAREKSFTTYKADSGLKIVFPEDGIYRNYRYEFSYTGAKDQEVSFFINKGEAKNVKLNGDGSQYTMLTEVENSVTVSYVNEDGVVYVHNSIIVVDDIPPALTIFENLDGITTEKDKITLTGKTESGATLLINEQPVELKKSGTFSYELSLKDGINEVTVSAKDMAGNISSYAIKINKGNAADSVGGVVTGKTANKILKYAPLVIALFGSLYGIIVMVVVGSGKKNQLKKSVIVRKFMIITSVFSGISAVAAGVWYLLRKNYEGSDKFIKMADDMPKNAYDYLQTTKTVLIVFIVFAAIMLLAVVAAVIANMVSKKVPKPPKPPKPSTKKHEPVQQIDAAKAAELRKAYQEKLAREAGEKAEPEAEVKTESEAEVKAEPEAEVKAAPEAEVKAAPEDELRTETIALTSLTEDISDNASEEADSLSDNVINETKAADTTKFKFCTNCGNKIKADAAFCGKCGTKQIIK